MLKFLLAAGALLGGVVVYRKLSSSKKAAAPAGAAGGNIGPSRYAGGAFVYPNPIGNPLSSYDGTGIGIQQTPGGNPLAVPSGIRPPGGGGAQSYTDENGQVVTIFRSDAPPRLVPFIPDTRA